MFGFLHWRSLFRRQRFEAAMDDEFAFHREARTNDLIAEGVPPAEARRRAQLEFGAERALSRGVPRGASRSLVR